MNSFPRLPDRFVPGDRLWLNGQPVTVLTVMGTRAHIIAGHHSWTGCRVEDLRFSDHSHGDGPEGCSEQQATARSAGLLTVLTPAELDDLDGFA